MNTTNATGAIDRRPLLRCLKQWLYDERVSLFRLSIASAFAMGLSLAGPHVSRLVFDRALPDGSPRLMLVTALGVCLIAAHSAWISWIEGALAIDLSLALERRTLTRSVRAMLHCSARERNKRDPGWMLTTLDGASSAAEQYAHSSATLLSSSLLALGYMVSLAGFSPGAAVVVVVGNLATTYLALLFVKFEASHVQRVLELRSQQQQFLNILLKQLAPLRGLFAVERLAGQWSKRVNETAQSEACSAKVGVTITTVENIGNKSLTTGLLLWAVYQCFGQNLSLGEMMFLLMTSAGLSMALGGLVGVYLGRRALGPFLRRVDELTQGTSAAPRVRTLSASSKDEIVFDRTSFRYDSRSRWILQNHNWKVRRGDVIHLRAPSGTGKSTMLRMIAGILQPSGGSVKVFGMNAAEAKGLVLYVPQSCELFEMSIRENLELFSGAKREAIQLASERTGLSQLLLSLPMGEETLVSAQGQNLSSGQRQLILLTAAFASSKPVLLLDESTSQIDAATKRLCQWDELTQGRTVIRVEHA